MEVFYAIEENQESQDAAGHLKTFQFHSFETQVAHEKSSAVAEIPCLVYLQVFLWAMLSTIKYLPMWLTLFIQLQLCMNIFTSCAIFKGYKEFW